MFQNPLVCTFVSSIGARAVGARLTWKITGAFVGALLIFGFLTMSLVYLLTNRLLHEQLDRYALTLAKNLGDAAAGHMAAKNLLALHVVVAKYALHDGVAYAFIKGRDGKIAAHSLGGQFSTQLQPESAAGELSSGWHRSLMFRNRPVYETVVPILAGQLGSAHIAMWEDIVQAQIYRSLLPIIGLMSLLLLVAAVIFLRLSQQIVRPIIRLRSMADIMSKGNLDTPVRVDSGDEIGELALSIERMRTSLKAAMVRLGGRPPSSQNDGRGEAVQPGTL